jgi:hypothetical protein
MLGLLDSGRVPSRAAQTLWMIELGVAAPTAASTAAIYRCASSAVDGCVGCAEYVRGCCLLVSAHLSEGGL